MFSPSRTLSKSETVNAPILSDPYLAVALSPAQSHLNRIIQRLSESDHPPVGLEVKSNSEAIAHTEIVSENYKLVIGDGVAIIVDIQTVIIDGKFHDMEIVASWNSLVETEMQDLIRCLQPQVLGLILGITTGLSPRSQVMPGLFVMHLSKADQAAAQPLVAEAACHEPVACCDDHPDFDAPTHCQGCQSFSRCHSHTEESQPVRKAA